MIGVFENLPGFLRRTRRAQGLKQHIVAAKLGVSSQQISRYESGESDIPAAKLGKLLAVYGFSLEDLGRFGEELGGQAPGQPVAPTMPAIAVPARYPSEAALIARIEALEKRVSYIESGE